ncbi:2'-5' RNA ligase [Candidatus Velamenicoccus archaeovorus]|uniref:RNA 2',3'-cyclic phosphodiesterase n=1 Tax=Velamenicoccus archaeovorus TaxID=1930593 RepID=A0A410P509_VELA1|nr:RNA 2',3'-cyclic phosphodiesterase [Candidatus Velamenicoccus archaeovorus]QAT17297.1 2'-5' RNA ligase [Candidatus Velamenicoccus archaeovorus]
MKRLFIAVELPKEIKEYLGSAVRTLQETGADAKWVESKNIHLTLKFLGATPVETIPAIRRAMTAVTDNARAVPTSLETFGGFPSLSAPRVLWVSLTDKEKHLERIVRELEDSLSAVGFAKENRPFKAHITLARLRSSRNRLSLTEAARKFQAVLEHPAFKIDNITLFESVLGPKGPAYSIIEQIKLNT